jgi:sulfhydrogenase subunit beta (sulfur reductase)
MEKMIIKKSSLEEWFTKIQSSGKEIFAPVKRGNKIIFGKVSAYKDTSTDTIQTSLSAKEILLPKFEEILRYHKDGKEVTVEDPPKPAPSVIFGVRPCDARSFSVLDAVYTTDFPDVIYQKRRENTAIIGLSCSKNDDNCFCTSMGGSPCGTEGSDILLTEMDDSFFAEIITDKGMDIVSLTRDLFIQADDSIDKQEYSADVKKEFSLDDLKKKLPGIFDAAVWVTQSLRCLGCGACSYVCPACSCYDIQDETCGSIGARIRCRDSCGLGHFTMHTSGHNPRSSQGQRWRQRMMHKFTYEPERYGITGCVGCGRCSRACHADINMLQNIKEILEV